ncbi:glycosyltransferase [Pseudomonas anguilliseptica]|uniref:glycosyltransferase n=1 Tax=Pseudomonas anguilliseptica TaxID=53406 RepID=UPI003735EDAE
MSVLNVMWSGGAAFVSVHKVHRQILQLGKPGEPVETLLLQSGDAAPLADVGRVTALGLSTARIKGAGLLGALQRVLARRQLAKRLMQQPPRVVLIDGIGVAAFILPLLEKLTATRAVVMFHGSKRLKAAHIALLRRFPAGRLDLVAVSATLAAELEGQVGLKVLSGRVAIEPVAFRSSLMAREAAQLALGVPPGAGRTIGAVGRLVPEKGFARLVTAIAGRLVSNPEDRLVIVGEGVERQHLAALAEELGVINQVHLTGHHAEVPRLYSAFDLICIPSEQEGLGLVLPEAVIAGVPVLASDLAVFREQLNGATGLLPSATEAWRDALNTVLTEDLGALAHLQRAGMDAEGVWARFEVFYQRLLAR